MTDYCTTCTGTCVRTQADWCLVEADQNTCQGNTWENLNGIDSKPGTNDTFGYCGTLTARTVHTSTWLGLGLG